MSELDCVRDFKAVYETPAGRRVLDHVLSWCHVYQTSMNKEALMMAFQEGERNIGLRILTTLNNPMSEGPTATTEQKRRSQK